MKPHMICTWVVTWVAICDFVVVWVNATIPPKANSESNPQLFRRTKQSVEKPYQILSSEEIYGQIQELQKTYPEFLRVTTSQEKYGLPQAGRATDCPFMNDGKNGCPNWILEIQDYTVHPYGSDSSNELPSVLWSGCLHGNERVGPTATMEAVTLLLKAAQCESTDNKELCRSQLEDIGMDNAHRKWLARLVTTRRLIVVPTANALGYFRDRREEGNIDPNRDFPYDLTDATQCMQTIAGRTLNEIYRDELFQLALTFHAGMEVVAYEWGAPSWLDHFSPDDLAQDTIASAYSRYGGGWSASNPYDYGTMNDKVYYVRGGMEDWAYAGSWDPKRVVQCNPTTFGGYPAEKTIYNNSTLRVFNMLVETSDDKTPYPNELGTSLDVLSAETSKNGHISRNIRLALLAAELVQPYVSFLGINDQIFPDDLPPLRSRKGRACQKYEHLLYVKDDTEVEIHFSVGGALHINDVSLWFAKWDDIPEDQLDCLSQPRSMDGFQKGKIIGSKDGTGYFSEAGSNPRPRGSSSTGGLTDATIGPIFGGRISILKTFKPGDKIVVLASALVDQEWAHSRSNTKPDVGPQSHVVNARTNPNWYHESTASDGSKRRIQGRKDWFSTPLTIVIGDYDEFGGYHTPPVVTSTGGGLTPPTSAQEEDKSDKDEKAGFFITMSPTVVMLIVLLTVVLSCCCLVCCCRMQRRRRARRHKALMRSFNQEDRILFDPEPYSDNFDFDDDDDDEAFARGPMKRYKNELELQSLS